MQFVTDLCLLQFFKALFPVVVCVTSQISELVCFEKVMAERSCRKDTLTIKRPETKFGERKLFSGVPKTSSFCKVDTNTHL